MTQRHDDHARSSSAASGPHGDAFPVADPSRIAAELAALGEDPVDDDELAYSTAVGEDLTHEDVLAVASLVDLSRWEPPSQGLLPLERERVWRRIAQHGLPVVSEPSLPAANGMAGWRGVVAGLAMVAGLALVPRFEVAPPASEQERADTEQIGEAARLAIEVLGDRDGARARALADDYAARLQASQGGDR